jgi:hypothetical protein
LFNGRIDRRAPITFKYSVTPEIFEPAARALLKSGAYIAKSNIFVNKNGGAS